MAFEGFAKFVSKKRTAKIGELLSFSGLDAEVLEWIGRKALQSMILSAIVFFTLALLFYFVFAIFDLLTLLIVSLLSAFLSYFVFLELFELQLFYIVDSRAKKVENILPDFLLLVANNVRSGLTPFAAFRQSARHEFGVLSEEVKVAAAKSLGTQSFEKALKQLSERIDSRFLRDTVSLFAQSLKSGSHLAKLLESSAMDLRKMQELRKEMVTSIKTYVLFVGFVALIATPLLLAISIQFLQMLQSIQISQAASGAGQFSFLTPKLTVTSGFMNQVAFLLLFGNSLLAGLFLGILRTGKAKHGLKYFPLLLIASIAVFFICQWLISVFFSTFFITG